MLRCFTGSCVSRKSLPATRLDGVSVASGGGGTGDVWRAFRYVTYHAGVVVGTMPRRLLRLMAVVLAGIAAYFAALAVLGFKVKEFARRTV